MISFETQSIPTGSSALVKRIAMVARVNPGLVSHTILSSGRMLRNEAILSRQFAGGPSRFGMGGCMHPVQQRLKMEMPTVTVGILFPCSTRGLCYGRISFDGIATVKNFRD